MGDEDTIRDEPQAPSRATAIIRALAEDPELRASVKQALAAEPGGLDTGLLRAYKDAALAYREASAVAKAAGEVKAGLEQEVGDHMALDGSWKWSDGEVTLSCNEFRFAAFPEGKEEAVHRLRKTDWDAIRRIALAIGTLPMDEKQAFEQLILALVGDETGAFLKLDFNAASLSAYIRERVERAEAEAKRAGRVLADEQDALPADWKGVIDVGSKWRVGVTASKR